MLIYAIFEFRFEFPGLVESSHLVFSAVHLNFDKAYILNSDTPAVIANLCRQFRS